jgi:hypothetical protein
MDEAHARCLAAASVSVTDRSVRDPFQIIRALWFIAVLGSRCEGVDDHEWPDPRGGARKV